MGLRDWWSARLARTRDQLGVLGDPMAASMALAGLGETGWVVDTPAVGLPAVSALPGVAVADGRPAGRGGLPRPPARAVVGASARTLPTRAAPPFGAAPHPDSTGPRGPASPGWRLALLATGWLSLAAWLIGRWEVRRTDMLTFLVLLALAALAPLATRRSSTPGGRQRLRSGLVAVWTVPIALLLPPLYALVAHVPLCLLPNGSRHGGAAAGEAGERVAAALPPPSAWRRRAAEATALGIAGALASWLHGALAPAISAYTTDTLVGSPSRLLALGAAALAYALAHRVLLPADHDRRRSAPRRPAWPGHDWGSLTRVGTGPLRAAELCAAVAVATLWSANPLLMLAAAPPSLLLARSLPPDDLLAAARTDPKTRLANAGWWREVAEAHLVRAHRSGEPLSVLLVDIDHFKQVNDRHGHLFGDTVLVAVADALRDATRPWDLVGRFGGEEFVVLLADVDLPTAADVAERIRLHVAGVRCPLDGAEGQGVSVTVSVGAAECAASLADALKAADTALYRAKANGRNRVELAADAEALSHLPEPIPARLSPHE
jgi:diguanylate cyclase (GGDEF)-like protein